MRTETFNAHFALLEQRWPWPHEAERAKLSYRDRLWKRVHDWRGRRVTGFQQAIEKLVSVNRTLPHIDSLVSTALAAAGEGSFQGVDRTDYTPPAEPLDERKEFMAGARDRLTARYHQAVEHDRERAAARAAELPDQLQEARAKIRAGLNDETYEERVRSAMADSTRREPEDPDGIQIPL